MNERPAAETLTIVIPAYNEEAAIGGTISRCLEARPEIERAAGVRAVSITVISDGSTDRTAEIARGFADVKVIAFGENRGYGAAIKEGFAQSASSLVAFLDADGTCDPHSFAPMCRAAVVKRADIVLGSRMGPGSKMPAIRRLGNKVFALVLSLLTGRQVSDTASGMRVIRREALTRLYPLPDRMHFTPAMSARAIFDGLHIVEVPMPYAERIGQSKLRACRDGVRFLQAIFAALLCYRPERLFLTGLFLCLALAMLLAAYPIEFYWHNGRLEEWMIYRFVACFLLGSCGHGLLTATALAHEVACSGPRRGIPYWPAVVRSLFTGWCVAAGMVTVAVATTWLLWPGIVELLSTGHTTLHWSRLLVGAFGLLALVHTATAWILLQVIALSQQNAADNNSTLPFIPMERHDDDAQSA